MSRVLGDVGGRVGEEVQVERGPLGPARFWRGQGHYVVGVDNFITGKDRNIAHLRANPRYRFVRADVTEPLAADLVAGFERDGLDRIYHMASPASPIGYVKHQVATLKVNSQGT